MGLVSYRLNQWMFSEFSSWLLGHEEWGYVFVLILLLSLSPFWEIIQTQHGLTGTKNRLNLGVMTW